MTNSCSVTNGSNGSLGATAARKLSPFGLIFEDMERALRGWPASFESGSVSSNRKGSFLVSIAETESHYLIEADLPGVKVEELDISVKEGTELELTVAPQERKLDGKLLHQERKPVSGKRVFSLPQGVDADSIKAVLTAGVLRLEIAKLPERQPKKIVIQSV